MFTDPVSQVYPFVLVVLLQGIGVKVIEWHTIRKVKGKHERNFKSRRGDGEVLNNRKKKLIDCHIHDNILIGKLKPGGYPPFQRERSTLQM